MRCGEAHLHAYHASGPLTPAIKTYENFPNFFTKVINLTFMSYMVKTKSFLPSSNWMKQISLPKSLSRFQLKTTMKFKIKSTISVLSTLQPMSCIMSEHLGNPIIPDWSSPSARREFYNEQAHLRKLYVLGHSSFSAS